jgi:hypothetical protein
MTPTPLPTWDQIQDMTRSALAAAATSAGEAADWLRSDWQPAGGEPAGPADAALAAALQRIREAVIQLHLAQHDVEHAGEHARDGMHQHTTPTTTAPATEVNADHVQ